MLLKPEVHQNKIAVITSVILLDSFETYLQQFSESYRSLPALIVDYLQGRFLSLLYIKVSLCCFFKDFTWW